MARCALCAAVFFPLLATKQKDGLIVKVSSGSLLSPFRSHRSLNSAAKAGVHPPITRACAC